MFSDVTIDQVRYRIAAQYYSDELPTHVRAFPVKNPNITIFEDNSVGFDEAIENAELAVKNYHRVHEREMTYLASFGAV